MLQRKMKFSWKRNARHETHLKRNNTSLTRQHRKPTNLPGKQQNQISKSLFRINGLQKNGNYSFKEIKENGKTDNLDYAKKQPTQKQRLRKETRFMNSLKQKQKINSNNNYYFRRMPPFYTMLFQRLVLSQNLVRLSKSHKLGWSIKYVTPFAHF